MHPKMVKIGVQNGVGFCPKSGVKMSVFGLILNPPLFWGCSQPLFWRFRVCPKYTHFGHPLRCASGCVHMTMDVHTVRTRTLPDLTHLDHHLYRIGTVPYCTPRYPYRYGTVRYLYTLYYRGGAAGMVQSTLRTQSKLPLHDHHAPCTMHHAP